MIVVATRATKVIARHILAETEFAGAEAVLRHLPEVDPAQIPALIVVLAKAATTGEPPSLATKPGKPLLLTEDERRRAHTRWMAGARDRATLRGEREYQRASKRTRRAVA